MNAGEIVYLIDDDCGVRHSVSALLESAHMSVVAFDSAATCLQQSRANEASCILLDLQLPGISGLDLQSKLAEQNSPPVIFISGRSDVTPPGRAMKGGPIEFQVKPVPSDVLLAAVRAAIAKDKLLREERAELA